MLLDASSITEFDGFQELEVFWYTLADDYTRLNDDEKLDKLRDLQPLYSQLVEIAATRICLSDEIFQVYEEVPYKQQKKLIAEKKKSNFIFILFSRDRDRCKSLLRDCVNVIGYEGVIFKLNDMLLTLLDQIKVVGKYTQIYIISRMEGIFVCLKTMLCDSKWDDLI